ncbi:MAG: hypothetical protein ACKVVP_04810 [Chloroflexota bacterium]
MVVHEQSHDATLVIRPMGIGEILDAGFSLARNHFRLLVTIVAWGVIPGQALGAIGALMLSGFDEISVTETLTVGLLLGSVLSAFGGTLAVFALQIAVAKLIDPSASEVPMRPWPLYRAGIGRMFFWAIFVLVLVIAAIPLFVLFPLGIYLMVRWSLLFIPFVVEQKGPVTAMKRSWALTSRAWWHTALVLGITSLVMSVLQGAIGAVLAFAGLVLGGVAGGAASGFATLLAQSVAGVLFSPFSIAIYTVLYYELRARNEGFDLTQRSQQMLSPRE